MGLAQKSECGEVKQTDILKEAFDLGEILTFLETVQRYGILALSQRCTDLRREGYPVESKLITLANGKRISQYRKAPEVWKHGDQGRLCLTQGGAVLPGIGAHAESGQDRGPAHASPLPHRD